MLQFRVTNIFEDTQAEVSAKEVTFRCVGDTPVTVEGLYLIEGESFTLPYLEELGEYSQAIRVKFDGIKTTAHLQIVTIE